MNDFQSGTTTALSSQRYFPNMRANRQHKFGLKLLILEQSVISATEKAQVGVNDEHTRALMCCVGKFWWFFCVNLHSCGFYRATTKSL